VRKRAAAASEIVPKLRERLLTRSAIEWERILVDTVPCSIVRPVEDLFDHPQVMAEGIMSTIPHEVLGSYRGVAKPISFGRTPSPEPFCAPLYGQDTERLRQG